MLGLIPRHNKLLKKKEEETNSYDNQSSQPKELEAFLAKSFLINPLFITVKIVK